MQISARKAALAVLVSVVFVLSYAARAVLHEKSGDDANRLACSRIISLAPSVTETVFAAGLGDRVVGVTRYCRYPQEAAEKPKIGGYFDTNFEAIAALKPDLAVCLPEHEEARQRLSSLGIEVITVHNKGVQDILGSIAALGAACGVEDKADEAVARLKERLSALGRVNEGKPRPRVLVSFARGMGSYGIKEVHIAGRHTFYDELIELAGGTNAYQDDKLKYPSVSREGIIALDPDVILDLVPLSAEKGMKASDVLKEWSGLTDVKAVRDGRVHVLGNDYVTLPGPRFVLLLEDMIRSIHPDAKGL